MLQPLTPQQAQWVDKTLNGLTLAECIGQLLCLSQFNDSREYWLPLLEKIRFGAVRGRSETAARYRAFLADMQ